MIITEKMIRELQRRVDISYEDAEKSLRRAGGNIDMAEIHAKKKANSFGSRLFREFEKIINATLIYRIRVYKKDDQFINVPILGFLLILIIIGVNKTLLLGVVFVVLALLADCNLQINKVKDQEEFRFYKTVNKEEVNKEYTENQKEQQNSTVEDNIETVKVSDGSIELDLTKKSDELNKNSSQELNKEENVENEDDDYYEVTIDK